MKIDPSNYKILIVDDVASNILLLKVLLSDERYKIITAVNGDEALIQASTETPDLILLDIMMPDMDGYEVTRRLKMNPETAEIPIIFLTALNATNDIVKGFQMGGNDFISKPFHKEELIIRVGHQISLITAKRIILTQTEELKKAITARDELYSVIARDLRSPIGSVKLTLNMLLYNLSDINMDKKISELLLVANRTTENVFALLDNLLKWTKCQLGEIKIIRQNTNLSELTEKIIELFSKIAELKDIHIHYETCDESEVNIDIDMIKTVIRNLLSNAIKFSNKDSDIWVKIEKTHKNIKLSIKDQGCGITEENQKKLLYTDTHFSTFGTNNEEGAGIGLLLCQDFIQQNDGKLWFISQKEKGSTFGFDLPL